MTREQSRAAYPDEAGYIGRPGARARYEVYGNGSPTILFAPTWSIVHSRIWKAQIPYFARRNRVIALDPRTGQQRWSFKQYDVTDSGIMTTATDLLFTGGREGYFHALDARTGELLWKASLGGQIVNGPISYEIDGRQYIATISGNNLVAFALRR